MSTVAPPPHKPAIVVVTSLVARGGVGGRAAVFALERLGHTVWFVPTVTLPFHPGHGPATRIEPPIDAFAALLGDLEASPWAGEVAAVLTGYMGAPEQIAATAAFIDRLRAQRPGLLTVCDPIAGDGGRLYVGAETAAALRSTLVPRADVVTPNLTELAFLTDTPIEALDGPTPAIAAAEKLDRPTVVVTSAPALLRNSVATLLVSGTMAVTAEHQQVANAPRGPGDLMAALLTAHLVAGLDGEKALERAVSSTFELVARSVRAGADEMILPAEQTALVRPAMPVAMRRIGRPKAS